MFFRRTKTRSTRYPWISILPLLALPLVILASMILDDPVALSHIEASSTQGSSHLKQAFQRLQHKSMTEFKNLMAARSVNAHSELSTLKLTVPNNTLLDMKKANKASQYLMQKESKQLKPYFKALLTIDDQNAVACKIRLRGWGPWHHDIEKPSLRIKIKTKEIQNGQRFIELLRPEDVLAQSNHISHQIAQQQGLITENIEHVRLFINNKYFGVYLKTMRQGEVMAIAHQRMPGTFFKGDRNGNLIWRDIRYWDKAGEEEPHNAQTFSNFLRLLKKTPSKENFKKFQKIFNMKAYARWSATIILTGSVHNDAAHNQSYFINSVKGQLEALVWDSNAYGVNSRSSVSPDIIKHPVMEFISHHPLWVHQRNTILYSLLENIGHPENISQLIEDNVSYLLPDLMADTHLSAIEETEVLWPYFHIKPYSVLDIAPKKKKLLAWALQRYDFLKKYFSHCAIYVSPHESNSDWCYVSSAGHSAATSQLKNGQKIIFYPGLSKGHSKYGPGKYDLYLKPAPLTYLVKQKAKSLQFNNTFTGALVKARYLPQPFPKNVPCRSLHPDTFVSSALKDIVLGPGKITIKKDIVTEAGQKLLILAGTELRLEKDVGIYCKGPTLVEGNKKHPVIITNAGSQPWAAFGISGSLSEGSRINYLHINGGSTGQDGSIKFKGMFNAYNCPDIRLSHCLFEQNHIGDDTVNLAKSIINVSHCRFKNARADALDLDYCQGDIQHSDFQLSGNDSLDLMSSKITVSHCRFERSGDKGVSIGEGSFALINNCQLIECYFGIQVKDSSTAVVENSHFNKNIIALNCYQKKWLYNAGGQAILKSCTFKNSVEADVKIEKKSSLTLHNTTIKQPLKGNKRIAVIDEGKK